MGRPTRSSRPSYAPTYLSLGYAPKDSGRLQEPATAREQAARLAPHDPAPRQELTRLERPAMAAMC